MRYFLVIDFGTKVSAQNKTELYKLFGGRAQMIQDDGGVMPDIVEITKDEYNLDDEYDVL